MKNRTKKILVSVVMGSKRDWEIVQYTSVALKKVGVSHECRVFSAHRTPIELTKYIKQVERAGVKVFIAAAGGAAHLGGVIASHTTLPVLGVPMTSTLKGLDSLLSIAQMPAGVPVGTLAIGKAGAINAALLAAEILAVSDSGIAKRVKEDRQARRLGVLKVNKLSL